MAEFRQNTW